MSSQVKAAAEAADEWIRQNAEAAKAAESGESELTILESDESEEAEVEQPKAESLEVIQDTQDVEQDEGILQEDTSDVSADIAELSQKLEKADARWQSLQGQVRSKDRQIEQLHELIANMNAVQQKAEAQAEPEVPAGFTTADVEAFGEDMIDVIERVARSIAAKEIGQYRETIDGLSSQVETVSQHTAKTLQNTFESELDSRSPNWRKLNEDQDYIDWLQESPTRQNQWAQAAEARDAVAVADLFNQYSTLKGLAVEQKQAKQETKKKKLESQVAPGKSRTSAAPSQSTPEGKNWSKTEIQQVYRDKGKYKAEEFAKLEREIAKAMQENRVDYTR